MFARVVRFTDVTPEAIAAIAARVEEAGGPPPGVRSNGIRLLHDQEQATAVFVGLFATRQDLDDADAIFMAMDPAETPGSRASIDRCQVVINRDLD